MIKTLLKLAITCFVFGVALYGLNVIAEEYGNSDHQAQSWNTGHNEMSKMRTPHKVTA